MKKWLIDHKIYFETIAATALTAMAVLVSFSQLVVANKQNSIAETQLLLAQEAAKPRIHAVLKQIKNPESGFYDEEELHIYNLGSPALSAQASSATWLLVELHPRSGNAPSTKIKVALNGYFSGTGVTQSPKDLMFVMRGYKNNQIMASFERAFRELAQERDYFGFVSLLQFIRVSYHNSLNQEGEQYFLVKPLQGSQEIAKEIGKQEFKEHFDALGTVRSIDFTALSAEAVIARVVNGN